MSWKAIVGVWLGSLWAVGLNAPSSQAQWVDVSPGGGVHVRAPFVSVDVYPHGGVSVRAPYAAVDVGGRPRCDTSQSYAVESQIAQLPLATPEALAALDDEALRQTIRATADRLRSRLAGYRTGYMWQQYLRPPDEVLSTTATETESYHAAIEKRLERFQRISADPQYSKLAQFPEFVAMEDALTEASARQSGSASAAGRPEELPTPLQARPTQQGKPDNGSPK